MALTRAEHVLKITGRFARCRCGWSAGPYPDDTLKREHEGHLTQLFGPLLPPSQCLDEEVDTVVADLDALVDEDEQRAADEAFLNPTEPTQEVEA